MLYINIEVMQRYKNGVDMKVAVPIWNGRVSPVFDTAGNFLVIDFDKGREISRETVAVPELQIFQRCRKLRELGIEIIICGAISNPALSAVCAEGIRVIPWISGDIEEVVDSFLTGALPSNRFMMPGCRGRGRRIRRGWIGRMDRGPMRGGRRR